MNKEEIQKTAIEERRLARAMEETYGELATLERTIIERRSALSTIEEDLKKPLTDKPTFVPIGGGVFIHASLMPTDKVLVNVGADIYLTKTKGDVKEFLEKSIDIVNKAYTERLKAFKDLRKEHNEIYTKLLEYQLRTEKKV